MTTIDNPSAASGRAPLLCELGEALFGDRWQMAMARALGVNKRTVQHWAAGRFKPSDDVIARLVGMLDARLTEFRALSASLHRSIPQKL